MPIYEYACQDCGAAFELLVRSDTTPKCPTCASTHLDKQLSVFATNSGGPDPAPMMAGPLWQLRASRRARSLRHPLTAKATPTSGA